MLKDTLFKADPGHIGDLGRRSAADIFNEVILPTVNAVTSLLPAPDTEPPSEYDESPPAKLPLDKAFRKPEDHDLLAQMYRQRPQPN